MPLSSLIESHRVILCVGSGGVGKTTTTAALGLLSAQLGKRTLCLTIDPARRLAQSLGLHDLRSDAQVVDKQLFEQAGLEVKGSLTVMMLDTKRTFDHIVERYASSPEARDRILGNKLYQYVSTALAGTQEYMAMEKLYEVKNDRNFDIIILDTPPTAHALDFLDAPQKLMDAIDSQATRWFVRAFQSTGKFSFNVLVRPAAVALRGVGRFTGRGFLEEVAEFLSDINELFGGFTNRAREVQAALRADDVGYVLVTSPSPPAIREALFFADRLSSLGMTTSAFVVNRIHMPRQQPADPAAVRSAIAHAKVKLDDDADERLLQALRDELIQARVDADHLTSLNEGLERFPSSLRLNVPAFPYDVHDIRSLADVVEAMRSA